VRVASVRVATSVRTRTLEGLEVEATGPFRAVGPSRVEYVCLAAGRCVNRVPEAEQQADQRPTAAILKHGGGLRCTLGSLKSHAGKASWQTNGAATPLVLDEGLRRELHRQDRSGQAPVRP
jgi:hypothetical protein